MHRFAQRGDDPSFAQQRGDRSSPRFVLFQAGGSDSYTSEYVGENWTTTNSGSRTYTESNYDETTYRVEADYEYEGDGGWPRLLANLGGGSRKKVEEAFATSFEIAEPFGCRASRRPRRRRDMGRKGVERPE